jgi:PTS system mannose-specific IIA component
VGPQRDIAAICIGPEDDMEQRRQDILQAVRAVDSGEGVVLLTDMFGGTPSNLAIPFLKDGRVEIVTGANLPMLLRSLATRREEPLAALAHAVRERGRKSIEVASELLSQAAPAPGVAS